jgi:phosphatidylserine decarboxylase
MIRIHREGRWITAFTLLLLLVLIIVSGLYLPPWFRSVSAFVSLVVLVLVLRFFRVPERNPLQDERTVTAPADGKVVVVEHTHVDEFLSGPCIQVSIFMSFHDVHVNYFPAGGTVRYLKYHPGKYLLARHPKSSLLNERHSTGIETPYGSLLVTQIAGTVARRVRCYAVLDGPARQGGELGFIKFGSRVDLFLPTDAEVLVKQGQRVTGALSPIALLKKR